MKKKEFKTKKYKKPELFDYGNIKNITKGEAPMFSDGDEGGESDE